MSERLRQRVQAIIDRATITDEKGVKRVVRRVLNKAGVYTFMPPAQAYGKSGISDIIAIKYGKAVFIETKFKYNKPSDNQIRFGDEVESHGAVFVVINERNMLDRLVSTIVYFETGVYTGDRRL